jgi:exopolysaccharide biosynthesis predicted pyruvyltransferase EpsI
MTIKQLFKNNNDKEWMFITPGGNQGDHMIYTGAHKLAENTQLDYTEKRFGRNREDIPKIGSDDIIYIHGGGGWCTWWNWTPRLVNLLSQKYPNNSMVVGPSTVAEQRWYLNKWLPKRSIKKRIAFYAREHTTYNYMKNMIEKLHMKNIKIYIDHDTSLHLEKGDEWLNALLECEAVDPFKLAVIRKDVESSGIPESVNIDDYDVVVDACQKGHNWAQLHLYASEILTDRSHSAILGAILGKKTKMFRGNYHKNRSIWEYSLKQRGVEWVE